MPSVFSATAVVFRQLLPVDSISEATPPFVQLLSNAYSFKLATSAWGPFPQMFLYWRITLEQISRGSWQSLPSVDCGLDVGRITAPRIVPIPNSFAVQRLLLEVSLPLDIILDERLHCAIRQSVFNPYAVLQAIHVEALGNHHPGGKFGLRAQLYFVDATAPAIALFCLLCL